MRGLARLVIAAAGGAVGLACLVPVLVIGAPFWLVAAVLRALGPRLERPTIAWRDLFVFDPRLGWRARPRLDVRCREDRDDVFRVVTDDHGWAGTTTLAESDIVVLGDSYAFGYGVDPADAFAARVPGLRVKGVGVPAYNTVQELLVLREIAPDLRGKLVVWLVFIGNDLYDNLAPENNGYRAPFVAGGPDDGGWHIVTRHLSPTPWTASVGRRGPRYLPTLAALHRSTPLAERAYEACRFLLAEGRDVCAGAAARLVVAGVPTRLALDARGLAWLRSASPAGETLDPLAPDRRLADLCVSLGVPYISLAKHLTRAHYKADDDHWNEDGHVRFAAILRRLHAELSPRPDASPVGVGGRP